MITDLYPARARPAYVQPTELYTLAQRLIAAEAVARHATGDKRISNAALTAYEAAERNARQALHDHLFEEHGLTTAMLKRLGWGV